MPLTCADCFHAHKQAWLAAFDHDFLLECKKGTISTKQFDTWLAQDYHFAKEFTRLAAALLTSAPYHDFELLLGGLDAMRSELTWFQVGMHSQPARLASNRLQHKWTLAPQEQAKERNLELDVSPQEANTSFCKFMQHVASQPYAVQAVAFWSIEQAYNEVHCQSPCQAQH